MLVIYICQETLYKLLSHPDNSPRLTRRFSLEGVNKTLLTFPSEAPSDRPFTPTISVLDVYDIAASIGKEFETIIGKYGPYSVSNLMPKVISVLEELEDFATKFESEGREIVTLQTAVHRLELEKLERKEDQNRHKKELEQIEEIWHSEVQELSQLIEKLKEENKQLKNAIEDSEASNNQSTIPTNFTTASIGKEFETIIGKYGPYSVSNLMPKVISVLEELEDFATKFESEGREIVTLQTAVHRLELEKLERKEDQNRHKKELEQIEEIWHSEVQELSQLIEKLKEENKQLKNAIEDSEASNNQSSIPTNFTNSTNIEEIQLMIRLKEIIDHQKIQIRSLRQQLAQKHVDLDAMQQQATRLAKLNATLRRKHVVSKQQADQLREEKLNLETQLNTKDQQIKQMQEHIHHSNNNNNNNNNRNTNDNNTESSICTDMSKSLIAELISPETPPPQLTEEQLVERLNAEGKMIIDRHDPNRPRFTLQELRNVLIERNELKSRLIEVEEELSVYKRAGKSTPHSVRRWDEDPPVQGPINREPDEKLYGTSRPNLGVKKFFESLLSKLNR
ncbi:unnamed protein product [Schistosoma turkestanicum]|nr:unnamed protein product [Schistosoma turkestanicum]CAH8524246.1 unnamed protein product [Schistosoma turkestanicum]